MRQITQCREWQQLELLYQHQASQLDARSLVALLVTLPRVSGGRVVRSEQK
jgi:hypothetical protein